MHQHLIYNGSLKSMRAEIKEMADKNIGSLSNFLKNDKNINYLNHINSNIPIEIVDFSISEKVYYFVYNIKNLILCDCGKHRKFIGFKNGYRTTCGKRECILKKRKETCIENWGVDNPKKSKQILEKENIKKKWGQHYMLSNVVKNKFKMTMIDNWGVEWPMQSREIKDKSLETWNKNPNKLNYEFCNIISYSDNSRGNGNLYKKIGFQYIGETPPNYYWVINRIKKHRFNFRKDKLVREGADPNKTEIEIMTELGFYRLFDCGSKKWNFFKNK
jgi:hypothetical protein